MRLFVLAIVLAGGPTLSADILHLRDGSRQRGELVSRQSGVIKFRIVFADGQSSIVRTFDAADVARVELTERVDAEPAPRMSAGEPELAPEDYQQMVREAFELLDDDDPRSALRALQRAVLQAPKGLLPELGRLALAERGVGLDELLAATRLTVVDQTPHFKLKFATPYERDALARLLERRQVERLGRRYQGRTVAEWTTIRYEYTTVTPDSRRLVADAGRAGALIGARLRFDGRLKEARRERIRLLHLRSDLARLAAHVLALPGYTAPGAGDDVDDPALRAARRMAAEEAQDDQGLADEDEATDDGSRGTSGGASGADAGAVDDRLEH